MSPGAGTALVTGGAGAIAQALTLRLQERGYDVVLADVDRDRLEEAAHRLPTPATLLDADLSTTAGIAALADWAAGRDDLTLLVNNAGYIAPGDVVDLTPQVVDRHVMVNLVAPMQLTRAAGAAMAARGRGDVLSLVSMGGIVAMRGSAAYSATKFGLRGFQTSVRAELAPRGVRVMGVFPSGVDTPMLRAEALHPSGSPLNFVGSVLAVEQVVAACLRALDSGRLETYVPYVDSLTGRLLGAVPGTTAVAERLLRRVGERGRARYLARVTAVDQRPAPLP